MVSMFLQENSKNNFKLNFNHKPRDSKFPLDIARRLSAEHYLVSNGCNIVDDYSVQKRRKWLFAKQRNTDMKIHIDGWKATVLNF